MLVVLSGKNATGKTNGIAEAGDIVVNRHGKPQVNESAERFQSLNDLRNGGYLSQSQTGGTYLMSFVVPFYLGLDGYDNAYHITENNELRFTYVPDPQASSNFDNLTVNVYGMESDWPELYDINIVGNDESLGGSVNNKPIGFSQQNICSILVKDPEGIMDMLSVDQDGNTKIGGTDWNALQALTNWQNDLESGFPDLVDLSFYTPNVPSSIFNQETTVNLTTSALGPVEMTSISVHNINVPT